MKFKILAIVFICQFIMARQKCHMSIDINNVNVDPSTFQNTIPVTTSMRRTHNSSEHLCNYYFYDFSKGNANSYQRFLENRNGDRISYNIFKSTDFQNILTEVADMNSNSDAIWGWVLATNQNFSNTLNLKINYNPSFMYPSGTYSDNISVNLFSGLPFNDPLKEDSANINFSFVVASAISLSLVDVGGVFVEGDTEQLMDFGVIENGETLEADLKVKSNAGYKVYMKSENKGKMKHESVNDSVTYRLYVDNSSVNLNAGGKGSKVADKSGVTPIDGDNLRLKVVMGDPSGRATGVYTDFVTITAETKE